MALGVAARLQYTLNQGLRVSGFLSQAIVGTIALGRRPTEEQRRRLPNPAEVLRDLRGLFERDLANIEAGIYKMPDDDLARPLAFSLNTIRYFVDLVKVRKRQKSKSVVEAAEKAPEGEFPKYFTQNFHFQTDGYLSESSAALYDHQVETVFSGGADAMRRQALVPLYQLLQTKAGERIELLDVACGTGRFLHEVNRNYPQVRCTGVDLSPWYLKRAREKLRDATHVNFVEANAESLPFRDHQFDVVSCIYLFHELPRRVREIVAAEIHRVLKPGGLLVFVDSIQKGDKPRFDASLEHFPVNFHEPYYLDYIANDLEDLFTRAGFEQPTTDLAFFSKVMTFHNKAVVAELFNEAPKPKRARKARGLKTKSSQEETH